MPSADSTCWTVLHAAAAGAAAAREAFATRYEPMVRAYLAARWKGSPLVQELDDAVQEVFVECLRQGGGLERAQPGRPGGFRAFLYGLVRNVALRVEQKRARNQARQSPDPVEPDAIPAREDTLSRVFDRAWAKTIMREAAARQAEQADALGPASRRRVELLRLRFQEGMPIREVAKLWNDEPAALHHEYARAREEFKTALLEVIAFYHPDSPARAERECAELLALLG
ncbi:MAG: sigma-70 family RNA polymerase sigma factor [Candidatus Rokubacteria bacterium]|nr:sigma-70 family RNA polymerase sigma factor [Candidatus Rokubacteria bacterium]